MRVAKLASNHIKRVLLLVAGLGVVLFAGSVTAQTIDPDLRPDLQRALAAQPDSFGGQAKGRANGYTPAQSQRSERPRETSSAPRRDASNARFEHSRDHFDPARHAVNSNTAYLAGEFDFLGRH